MNVLWLCVKVFLCRIIDMSLASLRTVYTVRGKSLTVAGISIVEGLVYFLIIKEALNFSTQNYLETINIAFAYAGGFATGTFLGSYIGNKVVTTMVQVQVVMTSKDDAIIKKIQDAGYALTVLTGEATTLSGEKYMIFSEIKNTQLEEFKKLIHSLDPKAFIIVNESKYVYNGFIAK